MRILIYGILFILPSVLIGTEAEQDSNVLSNALNSVISHMRGFLPHGTWEEFIHSDQRTLATNDSRWVDIGLFRSLWQEMYWRGGCGSLSTLACATNLGIQTTFSKVITEFGSGSTSKEQLGTYFLKRGLCYHPYQPLSDSCSVYKKMQSELDKNHEVAINMQPIIKGSAHIEHLTRVHIESENKCFGITNSWGSPAIIRGGETNFFHSRFSKFTGEILVTYETAAHCSEDYCKDFNCGENFQIEKELGFPNSFELSRKKIREYVKTSNELDPELMWASVRRMDHILYDDVRPDTLSLAMDLAQRVISSTQLNERIAIALYQLLQRNELKNEILKHKAELLSALEKHLPKEPKDANSNIVTLLESYLAKRVTSLEVVLERAIENRKVETIKSLVSSGFKVPDTTFNKMIKERDFTLLGLILESSQFSSVFYRNHFRLAIEIGDIDLCRLFVSKGIKVPYDGLLEAVRGRHTEVAQLLLENSKDVSHYGVLEGAINNDDVNMIALLLKGGLKVSANEQYMIVHRAAEAHNFKILGTLLQAGFDPNEFASLLWFAVSENNVEHAKFFLEHHVKPREDAGLIKSAVIANHLDMVSILLDNGIEPTEDDLEVAQLFRNTDIIKAIETKLGDRAPDTPALDKHSTHN